MCNLKSPGQCSTLARGSDRMAVTGNAAFGDTRAHSMTMAESRRSGHWKWPAATATVALTAFPAWSADLSVKISHVSGAPLADAVVYLLPKAGTRVPVHPPRAMAIEQIDREFVPYVTPVQAGTTVNFPNRDTLLHHVYSFSPAKSFEIKLY